jgi:hypothetical protein
MFFAVGIIFISIHGGRGAPLPPPEELRMELFLLVFMEEEELLYRLLKNYGVPQLSHLKISH